jgi:hypothetical protein
MYAVQGPVRAPDGSEERTCGGLTPGNGFLLVSIQLQKKIKTPRDPS